jgi:glycerophosphoryl diester phosphodiesterase
VAARPKTLVAHRGASAYAPEHTRAAYRLAIEQGADYVEQDLAVTRDGVLICLHDATLDRTTDVGHRFPDRATINAASGRREWLAIDFTLAEIRQLDAGGWFDTRCAGERMLTWEEAVEEVGTAAGLYPELKTPEMYRARGVDQTGLFLRSVRRLGLDRRPAGSVIVQCFEDAPLREVAAALPSWPRTFLVDAPAGADWLSPDRLAQAAVFATGIGPAKRLLAGRPDIIRNAHAAGLTVTPYTFRSRDEMRHFLYVLGVDALFTDNPDQFPRTP